MSLSSGCCSGSTCFAILPILNPQLAPEFWFKCCEHRTPSTQASGDVSQHALTEATACLEAAACVASATLPRTAADFSVLVANATIPSAVCRSSARWLKVRLSMTAMTEPSRVPRPLAALD